MTSVKDIAADTGFSVPTVSAVLGGRADKIGIKEETRSRIREAARRLNYRPNLAARGLRTRQTFTIGLMFYSPRELLYAEMLTAMQVALARHGYAAICAFWKDSATARDAFKAVIDRGVDGLISCHDDTSLLPEEVPAILFEQRHPRYDSVVRDGEHSMRAAVNYLVDHGHQRLGTIFLNRQRFDKLIAATLRQRGIAIPPFWSSSRFKDHGAAVRDCMNQLMALPTGQRPTAVICRNDTVAMQAISLAGEYGLVVPRDLSIIGSDGVALGEFTNPPLTTFCVPPAELAKLLVKLLLRRLQEPDAPVKELLLQQRLIERASCRKRTPA